MIIKSMPTVKLLIAALLFTITANAQKLPNKQEISLRAPATIKIDGKAGELDNKFQAYNSATDVFYTLSNDDNNLYLIVQATKARIIEKIIAVGVTFIVNTAGEKNMKGKGNKAIVFPLLSVPDGQKIISIAGIKTKNAETDPRLIKADGISTIIKQPDSLIMAANKMLVNKANIIKTAGINEVPDTLSIYNEHKIQVASAFNGNSAYTYELSIPLKYLGLSTNIAQKFSYGIQLKSRLDDMKKGVVVVYRYTSSGEQYNVNEDLDATTDFSGEYTLAKK
ncbi:MAG: hypothetical protein ABI367_03390 [Mucilaginibacter sp.]